MAAAVTGYAMLHWPREIGAHDSISSTTTNPNQSTSHSMVGLFSVMITVRPGVTSVISPCRENVQDPLRDAVIL